MYKVEQRQLKNIFLNNKYGPGGVRPLIIL